MTQFDAIVIGGGLVGAAIGYGLVRDGLRVAIVDEGDIAFRASRGNFGLVWVQSKGLGAPHYQRWTRLSAEEWPALAAELGERTGISVGLEQPGGLQLCLGEEELEKRRAMMAPPFGLLAPVRPQRGQILVTERTNRIWPLPLGSLRQTQEGTIMLGSSEEDVGFDTGQKPAIMRNIARRAVLCFPWIAELQIVRAWAALRVMPPDGLPIYDESEEFPGAFTANCHSGVTLAGAHANAFAPMVAAGALDPMMMPFSAKRFDVSAAA